MTLWEPHDSVRIERRGDRCVFVVRRVQSNEAVIAVLIGALIAYVLWLTTSGWGRVVGVTLTAALALSAAARSFRIRIEADDEQVLVMNYWRTFRFSWDEIREVGVESVTQGPLLQPALSFSLADGGVVNAQATPRNRKARAKLAASLASLGPRSVAWDADLVGQAAEP